MHGGKIVEEHVLPAGRAVTVGSHPRSDILLPDAEQSERTDLFVVRGGRLHLKLLSGARGKLSVDGVVRTFDSLALDDATARRGGDLLYPLADDARGKVQVRDYTLLFQLVDPPPRPADRRGALTWSWRDVDWVFLGLVAISALVHAAAVAWIEAQPPPTRTELRELVHQTISFALPAPVAEVPPEPITQDAPEASDDPTVDAAPPVPTPAADVADPSSDAGGPPVGDPDADPDPYEGSLLWLIGGALDNPESNLRSLLEDGRDFEDVRNAIEHGEVHIARDRDLPGLRGLTTDGDEIASLGPLGPVGDCVDCPARPTRRPDREPIKKPALVVDPMPAPPTGDFDIRPWLSRLHPRFKACYEKELKLSPDLSGRVSVSFATDGAARVFDTRIDSNSTRNAALGACILKHLNRLSLPAEGADLDVAEYTLMFAPQ